MAALLGADLTYSGNLFHFPTVLTENEYDSQTVPSCRLLVFTLSCNASLRNISVTQFVGEI
jgi:hypothetical protein